MANYHRLIIKAKQSDLSPGLTQIAIAMTTVIQWSRPESDRYYDAVVTGNVWKFGFFQSAYPNRF